MNNYQTPHSLPAGLKPASVENSGLALPFFCAKMLCFFSGIIGEKAREDTGRAGGTYKKMMNNGVICLFTKEEVI